MGYKTPPTTRAYRPPSPRLAPMPEGKDWSFYIMIRGITHNVNFLG